MSVSQCLTKAERRRSIGLSYANAGLWALGNGLASTTLVIYLSRELGAHFLALGVAWLRAAPHLVGLLRLSAPAMIDRFGDRKQFCIISYRASAVLLIALPLVAAPGRLPSATASLLSLIALWSGYHLLEYLGTIALWSWLADLVPQKIRGSFIGRRNLWLLWGAIAGMLLSGGLSEVWQRSHPRREYWLGYALAAGLGAAMMLAATLPLARMAAAAGRVAGAAQPTWRALVRPFADTRYRRLVGIGVWLSFCNGVTQSTQFLYPLEVLGLGVLTMHALAVLTQLGQSAVSPSLGRLADRIGNRPVLVGCQALVALGPLFYLAATPAAPWWIAGAWVAWIAYAGLNIGLPNLMLKLAPGDDRPAYVAAWFAVTGVAFAVSTMIGGALHDLWQPHGTTFSPAGEPWGFYELVLLSGWAGRTLGAVLLMLIIEPGLPRNRWSARQ